MGKRKLSFLANTATVMKSERRKTKRTEMWTKCDAPFGSRFHTYHGAQKVFPLFSSFILSPQKHHSVCAETLNFAFKKYLEKHDLEMLGKKKDKKRKKRKRRKRKRRKRKN